VKEAIAVPGLEFDQEGAIEMPAYDARRPAVEPPRVPSRTGYNPFKETNTHSYGKADWGKLYEKTLIETEQPDSESPSIFEEEQKKQTIDISANWLQYKGKYLITVLKSGLAFIHQRRAHIRILYDEYMRRIKQKQGVSQGLLFPEIISFSPKEATVLPFLSDDLSFIGFDLAALGNNTYSINGVPAGSEHINSVETLQNMVDKALETGCEIKEEISEALALALAKKAAIPSDKFLSENEFQELISKLFSSSSPNYTPDGKLIIFILTGEELDKKFK
jgi:DNA mismatch repair protein MutL